MDRTLRILPWLVTAALSALVAGGIRRGGDLPASRPLPNTQPQPVIAIQDAAGQPASPQLLGRADSARALVPLERPEQLVLTTGFPEDQPVTELASLPWQDVSDVGQPLERLPSAYDPSVESAFAMPAAETALPVLPSAIPDAPREASGPMISPLATDQPNRVRSVQLEQVARQADRQTRHGFELAGRGAYFAARSEFIGALRLIAEGLDTEQETKAHSRALAAALVAMKEAEDFLPGGSRLEADLDLAGVVAGHTTPVLKDRAEQTTPLTALKCYFTFAQEQLSAAAGCEVAGSMALHALGKLHNAVAQKRGMALVASQSKAMVFYQSALLVYPKNYMAANDLGVLLAQCGNYAEAQAMLEHSLSLCRQATSWQNLAAVYRRLGQPALAARADRQATLLRQVEVARRQAQSAAGSDVVQWVDPQVFAQTSNKTPTSPGAVPAGAVGVPAGAERVMSAGRPAPAARSSRAVRSPPPTPTARGANWGDPAYQR